jgi:uncharacterized protein
VTIELRQVRAAPGRQVVEAYSAAGFRVSGASFSGSVLILPDRAVAWEAASVADITAASLAPVTARDDVEILLLGTGARMALVPMPLRGALKQAGIAVEPMETGAACRTYNVLVGEDRRVAAALLLP